MNIKKILYPLFITFYSFRSPYKVDEIRNEGDACKFKKKGGGKKLLYYRYEIHVVLINGKIIVGWYLFYEHKKNRRFKKFSGRREHTRKGAS